MISTTEKKEKMLFINWIPFLKFYTEAGEISKTPSQNEGGLKSRKKSGFSSPVHLLFSKF
jgi:hypothetical protein